MAARSFFSAWSLGGDLNNAKEKKLKIEFLLQEFIFNIQLKYN